MRASWFVIFLIACGGAPAATSTMPAPKPVAKLPPGPAPTDVAARVGPDAITVAEIDARIPKEVRAAEMVGPPDEQAYRLAELRHRTLDDMIDDRAIVAIGEKRGLAASDAEVDAALAEIKSQNKLSDAEFAKILSDQGFTVERYRVDLRNQLTSLRVVSNEVGKPEDRPAIRKRLSADLRRTVTILLPRVPRPAVLVVGTIDIAKLVSADDLAAALKRQLPAFTAGPLADEPSTARYGSLHFKATGKAEASDAAIRIWRGSQAELDERWTELKSQLPKVVEDRRLGTASFTATESGIFGVGFRDAKTSVVVLITCGNALCVSADDAFAIAKLAHGRLGRLVVGG